MLAAPVHVHVQRIRKIHDTVIRSQYHEIHRFSGADATTLTKNPAGQERTREKTKNGAQKTHQYKT